MDKCPDKNAKLNFTLSAYIKEEVSPDAVSQASNSSNANNMSMISHSAVMPDFKKKKVDDGGPLTSKVDLNQRAKSNEKAATEQRIPMVNKAAK